MTRRDDYTRFYETASDLPLFMQPWYLDAVCEDGGWDLVAVKKAGRIVAVWPYFLKKKWGRRYVVMPPLARMMGPYVLPEYRSPRKESSLITALLDQLPSDLAAFEQDFNYSATNWLPFYWRGFRQTTRYSYILKINDLNSVWENMAADYRNQKIPKARQRVEITTGGELSDFLTVHNRSYERQGLEAPVSFRLLSRLDNALAARRQREIFFALDRSTGEAHSVAYLVWDRQAAYYLMAGGDPALRHSGADILLAWKTIRYAHDVVKVPVFDFMGSMIQPIERVRRQFGAVQKPYFRVWKEWSPLWKIGKILFR